MMIAAVLVTAACGSASESSVGTNTSPSQSVTASVDAARAAAEASADALISAMGDERAALAAVLLAGDLGYGIDQIVPAGVEGRLQPDGSISSADGTPLTPDYGPSGILDDDVTGDVSEAVGFRSPPERIPLTALMDQFNQLVGGQRGSLMTVLVLYELGYSLEQIVVAVLADGSVTGRLCLVDESGNVIEPHRSPTRRWQQVDGAWCKGVPNPTVTSVGTTAPGVTAPAATEPAAESEGDGSSDAGPLSGTWIMWWINANGTRNDAFRIRFNGVGSGTLEILNDETEIDTFFTVDGDLVTFGFTRLQALDPEYYTQDNVPDISFFIGEFEDDNSIEGLWTNEGYSCSPVDEPPCVLGTEPFTDVAGLTRES